MRAAASIEVVYQRGAHPGKKLQKARTLGVALMTEEQLRKLVQAGTSREPAANQT